MQKLLVDPPQGLKLNYRLCIIKRATCHQLSSNSPKQIVLGINTWKHTELWQIYSIIVLTALSIHRHKLKKHKRLCSYQKHETRCKYKNNHIISLADYFFWSHRCSVVYSQWLLLYEHFPRYSKVLQIHNTKENTAVKCHKCISPSFSTYFSFSLSVSPFILWH